MRTEIKTTPTSLKLNKSDTTKFKKKYSVVAELKSATGTFRKSYNTNYKDLHREFAVLAVTGYSKWLPVPDMTPSPSVFISSEFNHYGAPEK